MPPLDTTDNTSHKHAPVIDENNMVERNHLVNATIQQIKDACSKPGETMRNMIIVDQVITNLQNADGGFDSARFKNDLRRVNQGINPDGPIVEHALPFLQIVGANDNGKTVVFDQVTEKLERLVDDNGVVNPQIISDKNLLPNLFLTANDKDAEAWRKSVSGDNVVQGIIGDCYFSSALESLARKNPDAIKNMIEDNGRGADGKHTYTVTFPGRPDAPVTVSEPNAYETSAFSVDRGGLWSSIIEKAHRKLEGLSTYDKGGYSSDGMRLLTSETPTNLNIKTGGDKVNDALDKANDKDVMITCTTNSAHTVRDEVGNVVSIVPHHIYEVVSYDAQKGVVTVANPWGENKLDNAPSTGATENPSNPYTATKFDALLDRLYPGQPEAKVGRYITMTVDEYKANFAYMTSAQIQSN